jgi:hypothetical protein
MTNDSSLRPSHRDLPPGVARNVGSIEPAQGNATSDEGHPNDEGAIGAPFRGGALAPPPVYWHAVDKWRGTVRFCDGLPQGRHKRVTNSVRVQSGSSERARRRSARGGGGYASLDARQAAVERLTGRNHGPFEWISRPGCDRLSPVWEPNPGQDSKDSTQRITLALDGSLRFGL